MHKIGSACVFLQDGVKEVIINVLVLRENILFGKQWELRRFYSHWQVPATLLHCQVLFSLYWFGWIYMHIMGKESYCLWNCSFWYIVWVWDWHIPNLQRICLWPNLRIFLLKKISIYVYKCNKVIRKKEICHIRNS